MTIRASQRRWNEEHPERSKQYRDKRRQYVAELEAQIEAMRLVVEAAVAFSKTNMPMDEIHAERELHNATVAYLKHQDQHPPQSAEQGQEASHERA